MSNDTRPDSPPPTFLVWIASKFGMAALTTIVVALTGLALLVLFKGRSIMSAYHSRQARAIAEEANLLIKGERYEPAARLLQDGLRRHPDETVLLRSVAELCAKGENDPLTAMSFIQRVLGRPDANDGDRRRLAELLLQGGDVGEARRIYGELPPAEQTGRRGLELLSQITRLSGNHSEADQILRRALSQDPNDLEARLRLAIMDDQAKIGNSQSVTSPAIWETARRGGEVAMQAIQYLATKDGLTPGEARDLKALAESQPNLSEPLRYAVLTAYLHLLPQERTAVIEAETERTRERGVQDRFDFLRWLGTQGQYQRVLDLVPAESITRDAEVFLVYVDALSAAGRWKELLSLLQNRKPPVTAATAHVIIATCYGKLQPDMVEARRELSSAIIAGKNEVPVLIRAAKLAEGMNSFDLAVQAYQVLADASPSRRIACLEKIAELQRGDLNVDGLLGALKQLHELRPRNRIYADRLNYLRLVSGMEMEIAYEDLVGFQKAAASQAETPEFPGSVLRALATWRFGSQEDLVNEIKTLPDPAGLAPGVRAVVAGFLSMSGRDTEGFRVAEKVPRASLLEGERLFLRYCFR